MKLTLSHRLSLEEIIHIEKSVQLLHHLVAVSHNEACREFKDCHPMMALVLRDYITACIDQANALQRAQKHVNDMYKVIIQEAADESHPC